MVDAKLEDEFGRLAALKRYELLDTPPEAPFDRITGLVKTVLEVPIAVIAMIDSDRQWFKSCLGLDNKESSREISFCHHTIQARVPMYVPNASLDPRFADNPLVTGPPYIQSYLGIPLATPDGYNLGSLCAIDRKPRTYSEAQIEVLKSFAALVTDEFELRRLAQIDYLTGAATRRGFCLEIEKAICRWTRHQHPSALVVFDIDHFKRINDRYGHAAGDIVLREMSTRIASVLRASDILGRLGGEEFGILLADAGLHEAMDSAERARLALEAFVIEYDPPLKVTASFGVAILGLASISSEMWLAEADQALYAAKRAGRNRCCIAQASGQPW